MEDLRNITPEEYTDKDMQVVTQLAYIDFKKELYGMTIGEIFNNENYYNEIYKQYMEKSNRWRRRHYERRTQGSR